MPKCKIIGAPTKKAMVWRRRRRRKKRRKRRRRKRERDRIALAGDASGNHGVVRGELFEVRFHKMREVVKLPRVESNGIEAGICHDNH
jgi:hypothetical protein